MKSHKIKNRLHGELRAAYSFIINPFGTMMGRTKAYSQYFRKPQVDGSNYPEIVTCITY